MIARFLTAPVPQDLTHRLVWHPIALAAVFVLYVFVEVLVSPYAMLRSLVIAMAGAALVTALGWMLTRDRHKGGLIGALVVMIIVGWGSPLLVGMALALMVLIVLLVKRITGSAVPWARATYVLNILSVVLLVAIAIKIVTTEALGQIVADLRQGGPLPAVSSTVPRADGPPDIFLILFDAYPRADQLERLFDYDNQPFLQALEARGFEVSRDSHSNYARTELTLASVLNMRLLHDVAGLQPIIEARSDAQPAIRNVTNHATALQLLRERGYEVVASAPGYEEVALRQADVFVDAGQINEFETILMRETALADLLPAIAPDFMADQQRGRIEAGLESIRELVGAPSDKPRFALIHLPTPHAPIVYGQTGERIRVTVRRPNDYDSDGQSKELQVVQYREQLDYVNAQILAALDDALAAPGREPVIIIWSDHGSRIDLDTDVQLRMREQVSNLFAARAPGQPGLFSASHTLVNTLPILFDAYLGTDIPRADDRFFISQQTLLDLVEISIDETSRR